MSGCYQELISTNIRLQLKEKRFKDSIVKKIQRKINEKEKKRLEIKPKKTMLYTEKNDALLCGKIEAYKEILELF